MAAPTTDGAAVAVDNLVKRYGSTAAVDGLSLSVASGTVAAVLGPNGAGKTTTVECCEGYRRPDGGSVRVLGLDPVRDAAVLHTRVGVMLQAGGIYPGVRAVEMLRHVARLHADPLDVDALAERLGLSVTARTPYRRLSGGQQRRLALALAVVGRPDVVFLDEPTAGLDPQARRTSWELVEELRRDGVTVVLTTHAMDEAERLADVVHVIDAGRLVASGSPAELVGGSEVVRVVTDRPVDFTGVATVVSAAPPAYELTGMEPAAVAAWCAERRVGVVELRRMSRTLEDVFLELTGRDLR